MKMTNRRKMIILEMMVSEVCFLSDVEEKEFHVKLSEMSIDFVEMYNEIFNEINKLNIDKIDRMWYDHYMRFGASIIIGL